MCIPWPKVNGLPIGAGKVRVGVLALQGDYSLHEARLAEFGAAPVQVRRPEMLKSVQALVLPGGESTTLLRLLDPAMRALLCEMIASGLPTLATCAGLIILAKGVTNPTQDSLALIDVDVKRNAYGRQVDSFIDPTLRWTSAGDIERQKIPHAAGDSPTIEGVFIRAPRITRVGAPASVLVERGTEPVLIKQGSVLGATFHPELSKTALDVHQLLLAYV